jgi:hypothetical protein
MKSAPGKGSTLIETAIAMVVLSTAVVLVGQTVSLVALQRRQIEQRDWAAGEAANLMERAYLLPWEQLTTERLGPLQPSDSCRERLRDVDVRMTVRTTEGEANGRQITIQLDWLSPGGQRVAPLRLTAWRFPGAEDQP